jgi:hypothetical protein
MTERLKTQISLILEDLYIKLKQPTFISLTGYLRKLNFNTKIGPALLKAGVIKLVSKEGKTKQYVWANPDILPIPNIDRVAQEFEKSEKMYYNNKQNKQPEIKQSGEKKLYDLNDAELIKNILSKIDRNTASEVIINRNKQLLAIGAKAIRLQLLEFEKLLCI